MVGASRGLGRAVHDRSLRIRGQNMELKPVQVRQQELLSYGTAEREVMVGWDDWPEKSLLALSDAFLPRAPQYPSTSRPSWSSQQLTSMVDSCNSALQRSLPSAIDHHKLARSLY